MYKRLSLSLSHTKRVPVFFINKILPRPPPRTEMLAGLVHGGPVLSGAALLWACVGLFPVPSLRAHAAVVFALHWAMFLPSTFEAPQRSIRVADWARSVAMCATLLCVAVGLARVAGSEESAGLISVGGGMRQWVGKCVVASALVSFWAVVRTLIIGKGRRQFPHWHHGMTHSSCFLTCSVQAAFVFVQGAPLWLLTSQPPISDKSGSAQQILYDFSALDVLAIAVWAAGLIMAWTADTQRQQFAREAQEKGDKALMSAVKTQLTMDGLWAYCRHPDYFGAVLVWSGIAFFCVDKSMTYTAIFGSGSNIEATAAAPGNHEVLLSLLVHAASPMCTLALLSLVAARGLESEQRRKLHQLPWYRSYVADTPLLVPNAFIGRQQSSLEAERDADRNSFHQPSELGRYKSSRADTILEALAASKKKKIEARDAMRGEKQRARKHQQRSKTPVAAAGSARRKKKKRVHVQ